MKQKAQQIWVELTADKKKASILGALAAFGLIVGVRAAFTGGKKRPPTPATPAAVSGMPAASQPPAGAPAGAEAAGGAPAGTSAFDLRPPLRFASGLAAARDVFRLNPAFFPDVGPAPGAGDTDGANSATGSADSPVEEELSPQALALRRAQADVARLRLRSIMLGPNPVAIVESDVEGATKATVVRPGDTLEGFRVGAVTETGVTLERDGVEVTLSTDRKK